MASGASPKPAQAPASQLATRHVLALRDVLCDFGILHPPPGIVSKTSFSLDNLASLLLLVREARSSNDAARSETAPQQVVYANEWVQFARTVCEVADDAHAMVYFSTFQCLLKALAPHSLAPRTAASKLDSHLSAYSTAFRKWRDDQNGKGAECVPALGFAVFLYLQATASADQLVDELKRGDEYPFLAHAAATAPTPTSPSPLSPVLSPSAANGGSGLLPLDTFLESVELVDAGRKRLASFVRSHVEDILFLVHLGCSVDDHMQPAKSRQPSLSIQQLEVLDVFLQPAAICTRDSTGAGSLYEEALEAKSVPIHEYMYRRVLLRMNPLLPDDDPRESVLRRPVPLSELEAALVTDVMAYQPSHWLLKTTEKGLAVCAKDQYQLQSTTRRSATGTSTPSSPCSSPMMSPRVQRRRPSLPCPTSPCLSPATSPPSSPLVTRTSRFSYPASSPTIAIQQQLLHNLVFSPGNSPHSFVGSPLTSGSPSLGNNSGSTHRSQVVSSCLRDPFYFFQRHVLISPPFPESAFGGGQDAVFSEAMTPTLPEGAHSEHGVAIMAHRSRRPHSVFSPTVYSSSPLSSSAATTTTSAALLSPSSSSTSLNSASSTPPQPPVNLVVHESFLAGQHVHIRQASHVAIYLLGPMTSLTISDCHSCTIFAGAVASFLHLQRCYNVHVHAACGRYSLTQCANIVSYVCSNSASVLFEADGKAPQLATLSPTLGGHDPQKACQQSASSSSRSSLHRQQPGSLAATATSISCIDSPCCSSLHDLQFAPYNADYPSLKHHLRQADIDVRANRWDAVVPFWHSSSVLRKSCKRSSGKQESQQDGAVAETDARPKWNLVSADHFSLYTLPVQGVVPASRSAPAPASVAYPYDSLCQAIVHSLVSLRSDAFKSFDQPRVPGHPELTTLVTSFDKSAAPATLPSVVSSPLAASLPLGDIPQRWSPPCSLSKLGDLGQLTVPLPARYAAAITAQQRTFEQYRTELLKKSSSTQRQISSEIGETLFRWMESNGLVKELKGVQGMKKELDDMKRVAAAASAAHKMTAATALSPSPVVDLSSTGLGIGLNQGFDTAVSSGGE
ncbi:TBCC domain-containing protein 1 [Sorochytrium milnesiophthora]